MGHQNHVGARGKENGRPNQFNTLSSFSSSALFLSLKMSDGALTILDGSHLRELEQALPVHGLAFTGAEVLDLADSRVSSALYGFSLPETVKSSALQSIDINDVVSFRHTQLSRDQASRRLADYLNAIADRLRGT